MTKEEFIKKKAELKEKLYQLQKEYINSNSPIPNGTKVKITGTDYRGEEKVTYGFIESYYLFGDNITPSILAIKKDGAPSKNHIFIYRLSSAKIEPCE